MDKVSKDLLVQFFICSILHSIGWRNEGMGWSAELVWTVGKNIKIRNTSSQMLFGKWCLSALWDYPDVWICVVLLCDWSVSWNKSPIVICCLSWCGEVFVQEIIDMDTSYYLAVIPAMTMQYSGYCCSAINIFHAVFLSHWWWCIKTAARTQARKKKESSFLGLNFEK